MTVYDLMTIMDKLSSLRAFVKVVELGSFSEAGRQLRLSRSAISKYVSDLEQDLGVQLLNRTTRHASPNENGQAYFERALGILAELDAADHAVSQAQATPRGLLRVNAPLSFGTLHRGQGRCVAADLHRRRCPARRRATEIPRRISGTATAPLRDLSTDAALGSQGATFHRFSGRTLREPGPRGSRVCT